MRRPRLSGLQQLSPVGVEGGRDGSGRVRGWEEWEWEGNGRVGGWEECECEWCGIDEEVCSNHNHLQLVNLRFL